MRKINKTCGLSTAYKAWEEDLENKKEAHPKYNSSTGRKFYLDIVMQLFHCQDGLCAYTERRLCAKQLYEKNNWHKGRYEKEKPTANMEGQLDHFDPTLKSKKNDPTGKQDWLWSNFFMVHSDINTRVKGSSLVDKILKPDETDFDPFHLLDYDFETHLFIPNHKIEDPDIAKRVEAMLEILGVNYFTDYRRSFLEDKLRPVFLKKETMEEVLVRQFPTAFEMCKHKLENDETLWDDFMAV